MGVVRTTEPSAVVLENQRVKILKGRLTKRARVPRIPRCRLDLETSGAKKN